MLRGPKKAKGGTKAKKKNPNQDPAFLERQREVTVGCVLKKSDTEPAIKADSEYPDWVFSLADQKESLAVGQTAWQRVHER